MYQKTTFTTESGWLCVKYETTFNDRPELCIHYWPIVPLSSFSNFAEDYAGIEGAEAHRESTGSYAWRRAPYNWMSFHLKDGGKTLPIRTETLPVPPPKTKVQTRWYNGAWQKFLKAQGWVTA